MMRALGANGIRRSTGSVLRTGCIFDTPSLKGLRLEPFGSIGNRELKGESMENTVELQSEVGRLTGRDARTQSIATRFTPAEEMALLKRAEASGQNLREWAREVLLREVRVEAEERIAEHAFTELVGLQLLLMNALQPLLAGRKVDAEQFQKLVEQIQATKQTKARELLARRRAPEGKSDVEHL